MNPMITQKASINHNSVGGQDRDDDIYHLYINGATLQSIGEIHHLTRERIRQLIIRIITKKIKEGIWDGSIKNPEHLRIRELVREQIKNIQKGKSVKRIVSKLKSASEKGIIPEKYSSILKFAKDVGLNPKIIDKISPDISQKIKENTSVGHGGKRWSRFYIKCRQCGTSTTPHQSYGYCEKCFTKTNIFKEYQENSRIRNQHRWKARQKIYIEEYNDKKHFGGHREAVLKRDNYLCVNCGKSDTDCLKEFDEHLRITHLDKKSDHDMNNLISLCQLCCLKYIRSKRKK